MTYPYLTSQIDADGVPAPADPVQVPQHGEDCPGCRGDGWQLVVGPKTGFRFVPKACDGRPVPDATHS